MALALRQLNPIHKKRNHTAFYVYGTRLLGLIYRKEALSEKIQNIVKKDWLQHKVNLLDVNQLDIVVAAQTALKEGLIKSEKKQRYLLDCQRVIKTIILNLIEKTSLKFNLVKLASCLVENRCQSTSLKIVKHSK